MQHSTIKLAHSGTAIWRGVLAFAVFSALIQALISPGLAQMPKGYSCNTSIKTAISEFKSLGVVADTFSHGKEYGLVLSPISRTVQSRIRLNKVMTSYRQILQISKPVLRSCRQLSELYICESDTEYCLKSLLFDDGRLLLIRRAFGPTDNEEVVSIL